MTKIQAAFLNVKDFVSGSKHKDLEKYNDNKNTNENGIGRDVFFKMISEQGEAIPESELQEILKVIRGDSNIKSLPDNLTFQYLFEELLKFEVEDKKDAEDVNH